MPTPKNLNETDKDIQHEEFMTGRHQTIPTNPAKEFKRTTLAAGAVLWRGDPQDPEFAVIHRPHYDDWSLAKGKVDPGESLPVTAVREIREETGYEVKLGKLLGKVTYPVKDRTKVVYYWAAKVTGGKFKKNDEVDEIRWLTLDGAKKLVSYDLDKDVLKKAAKRLRLAPTTRVLYVRHGRAHDRKNWEGDDNLRPLDKKGRKQAEMLVEMLKAYHPTAIYSAKPNRCQQTVAPLAQDLELGVTVNAKLGDETCEANPTKALAAFLDIAADGGVPVICSQGLTIPAVIEGLSPDFLECDEETLKTKKGGVWVLHFNGGTLTGADYLASALPVK